MLGNAFLVSHANENDDQSYTIKHVYLHASSLLRAHVYVTLFGYKISPEFYESEEEDIGGPTEADVKRYLTHTVEYFEELNRNCSVGEHYWHSIKEVANPNNPYPIQLGHNDQSQSLFKLTIQRSSPCTQHPPVDMTYYDLEQNTDIYQFQTDNMRNVIEHIFTHVQDYSGLADFCQEVGQIPEVLANTDWQNIVALCQTNLERCDRSLDSCQKQGKIKITCEQIPQPIPMFYSEM